MDIEDKIMLVLGIVCALALIWEVGIITYAMLNADEVNCNLLWCEARYERTSIESRIERKCSVNGVEVNCSEFDTEFRDYSNHGINEINGVCPGLNDNRTVLDCMNEQFNSK